MKEICHHYRIDRIRKYISTVIAKGRHVLVCKKCKCILHDADVERLNKRIHYLNYGNQNLIPVDISDKIWMESPVPVEYMKDKDFGNVNFPRRKNI